MSYGLTGFKLRPGETLEHFREVMNSDEPEDYEAEPITANDRTVIHELLIGMRFRQMGDGSEYESNSIQLSVYDDQVGISLPYWDSAKDDFRIAMKLATELFKLIGIVFWDTQAGEVITGTELSPKDFEYGLKKTQGIRDRYSNDQTAKKPWWKFW